jgi:hypothetical protein
MIISVLIGDGDNWLRTTVLIGLRCARGARRCVSEKLKRQRGTADGYCLGERRRLPGHL